MMPYSNGILFYNKESGLFSLGNKHKARPAYTADLNVTTLYAASDLIYEVFTRSGIIYKCPPLTLLSRWETTGIHSASILWDLYYNRYISKLNG